MVKLRDMVYDDIQDYVRWFTKDITWMKTDAPWEKNEYNEREELKSWTEYYQYVKSLQPNDIRYKFEIECDGKHIGWVSSYTDLDYLENKEQILAIGIDIPEVSMQNKGVGTKALELFIDYLKGQGHQVLYLQTWGGNDRMLKVASKLGFEVFYVLPKHRMVEGKLYDAITLILDINNKKRILNE